MKRYIPVLMLLLLAGHLFSMSAQAPILEVSDIVVEYQKAVSVKVAVSNTAGLTSMQTDIILPSDIIVDPEKIALSEEAAKVFTLRANKLVDGRIIVVLISLTNQSLSETPDWLFEIPIAQTKSTGTFDVEFSYIVMTVNGSRVQLPDMESTVVSSAVTSVEHLYDANIRNYTLYNLDGIKVNKENAEKGFYIKVTPQGTSKIYIK